MDIRRGATALVGQLCREGAAVVFGIPGAQIMGLYDALYDAPSIRVVTTRHEQGAAYMADGYARTSGRPGVLLTVPGPGVYNACAGLATAYACSSPVLHVAGQVTRDSIGMGRGILHEVHDQLEIVKPVTKTAIRALYADDLVGAVHDAFAAMRSGRPRPTFVEMPPEALAEGTTVPAMAGFEPEPLVPDHERVVAAAKVLDAASTPMIVAGGGVVVGDAHRELTALADRLQALVVVTREGKAAIDNRHELLVGSLWANAKRLRPVFEAADVIVALGTRLEGVPIGAHQRVVRVDVDPGQLSAPNGVSVHGDAAPALAALTDAIRAGRESRAETAKAARAALEERLRVFGLQFELVEELRRALPDDVVLAAGTTTVGYMCHAYFPVYAPRGYLSTSYMGTLGFSLSMGIGAKLGALERPVVTVSGDGGFLFGATELATAVQHGVPIVNVVFNDNAYGNPNREQCEEWDGREIGTELHNPDFVAFAQSFGCDAVRVLTPESLAGAVRDALGNTRPTVIEVPHPRLAYVMRDPGDPAPVRRRPLTD